MMKEKNELLSKIASLETEKNEVEIRDQMNKDNINELKQQKDKIERDLKNEMMNEKNKL